MRFFIPALAAVVFLAAGGAADAAIYKWVDKNGVVSFQDTPPPAGVDARVVTPSDTRLGDAGSVSVPKLVHRQGVSYPKVELYVTSWCPSCKRAQAYLRSKNIPFTAYDVEKDRDAYRRRMQLDSRNGVPLAVIGSSKLLGFSAAAYDRALGLGR